uniref:Uncharacterized protein n=1 Tax=Setaria italica TaxID=4555 RepID=K3Z207_SETIT
MNRSAYSGIRSPKSNETSKTKMDAYYEQRTNPQQNKEQQQPTASATLSNLEAAHRDGSESRCQGDEACGAGCRCRGALWRHARSGRGSRPGHRGP